MESRPPQEPPRRPPMPGRKPAPPWLWVLLIGIFAVFIWLLKPTNDVPVTFSWFREQVLKDNVKSLQIKGLVATGVLRTKEKFTPSEGAAPKDVQNFSTAFPS